MLILPSSSRQFAKKYGKSENKVSKSDYSPFSVKLKEDQEETNSNYFVQKIQNLFSSSKNVELKDQKILTNSKSQQKQSSISKLYDNVIDKVNDLKQKRVAQRQAKTEVQINEEIQLSEEQIKKDEENILKISQLIESNINRKYFSERKLSQFFELSYQLKNPQSLLSNKNFKKFVDNDLKFICQSIKDMDNIYNLVKYVVYFRIGDDPEIMEILADQIKRNISKFRNNDLLEILVNFSHTLSPETKSLCELINDEIIFRLSEEYDPENNDLYIQKEDLPTLLNTMLDMRVMSSELKESVMEFLKDNIADFKYETLSEIAVIYSIKMDPTYKKRFFALFKEKFFDDLEFLDSKTLYKVLWSLIKSDSLEVSEKVYEWTLVKKAIQKKQKDMDISTLINLIVLSTLSNKDGQDLSTDLFETLQPDLILKMKEMALSDLVNLLWSAQEIKRGSEFFFKQLEKEISSRIRGIKDDDLILLLNCFQEDESNFSQKFLGLVLKVIQDKKDNFQLKTLVGIIFSLTRIDFNYSRITETLLQFKEYDRLRQSLPQMLQKSLCILLWTYSRDERLCDKQFLESVCDALLLNTQTKFELDNFDILLICQAIMHIERSALSEDATFLNKFFQLVVKAETFVQIKLDKMNIHEFTTVALFYFSHSDALSHPLLDRFLKKIVQSVDEFNELQLNMLLKAIIKCGVAQGRRFDRALFQPALEKIQKELDGIQAEKDFIEYEDKIRSMIQQRLKFGMNQENNQDDELNEQPRPFKPTFTLADQKLNMEMPQGSDSNEPIDDNEDLNPENEFSQPLYSEMFKQEQVKIDSRDSQLKQQTQNTQQNDDDKEKESQQKLLKYLKNKKLR